MRIVLAHSHANTFGGGERAVLEVGKALAERHEVELLLGGFDPRRTYAELASLPHRRFSRLRWPLSRVAAEAIVANSFGASLLALRNAERVAYWAHSTRSLFLQPGARRVDLLARRAVDWVVVRRTRLLVANSRYTASRLWQLYGREADAIVYPGVDLAFFQPSAAGHEPSGRGEPYAICVGRLSPEKGLDRLFGLWRDLADLPLHVVGSGPTDVVQELRAAAPQGVFFRGELTSSQLADAYRGATVAVFAPHGEEFGIAPLEAMASGVPVVAWREGGLQETVIDGDTGYLASDPETFRQRVRLVRHDRELRRTLGTAARRRAEQFSWRQTASAIEDVCGRLAGTPAPVPAG